MTTIRKKLVRGEYSEPAALSFMVWGDPTSAPRTAEVSPHQDELASVPTHESKRADASKSADSVLCICETAMAASEAFCSVCGAANSFFTPGEAF